jgi:ARID/BRIGHT DNA binding domain
MSTCPLCDYTGSKEETFGLLAHVAKHLEEIALAVLPQEVDDLDSSSEEEDISLAEPTVLPVAATVDQFLKTSAASPGPVEILESLSDEMMFVSKRYKTVMFEIADIHGREATVTLHGPWGPDEKPAFLRVYFAFPENYPKGVRPDIKIERSASTVSEGTMRIVHNGVMSIINHYCERHQGCMEPVISYLLGEKDLNASMRLKPHDNLEINFPSSSTTTRPHQGQPPQISQQQAMQVQQARQFLQNLQIFMHRNNHPFEPNPVASGQPINLHSMFLIVTGGGGSEQITTTNSWGRVAAALQINEAQYATAGMEIKDIYERNLAPYEAYVQHQRQVIQRTTQSLHPAKLPWDQGARMASPLFLNQSGATAPVSDRMHPGVRHPVDYSITERTMSPFSASVIKGPRRKYEEIERMYKCGWRGCEKTYGTLNHLNAHVTMQSHGQKRTPGGMLYTNSCSK